MARPTLLTVALLLTASLAPACDSSAPANAAEAKPAGAEAKPAAAPGEGEVAAKTEAEAPQGKQYGAPLTGAPTVTIEQVMDDPKAYEGKLVRVEGMVTDVCTMRGCWFEMAGERPGMKMRFKVQDGDMVFPPSAKGKKAVAEGMVTVKTLTLEETQQFEEHMAKDAGKEFDPASVTEPMTIVQLKGQGAVIADS
ncbi:MAG: DUF4920 domain-containing protein [Myxococcales bacterium]|nr:DUF4920 domain-containing protein [Myxococcales bacterium]